MPEDNHIHKMWDHFRSGDKEAFAWFYNDHVDALYHYGTKISSDEDLVKDAIQEVFLDLFLKRQNNNTNPENLRFYLLLALKRNIIRKLKKSRKLVLLNTSEECTYEADYCIEDVLIVNEEEKEANQKINDIINQLPSKQKETLYLRFNESLEYKEIAKLMDVSIESARKQVYRALKSIRESYGKNTFLFFSILLSR